MAIEEAIDQIIYLTTLRDQLENLDINPGKLIENE